MSKRASKVLCASLAAAAAFSVYMPSLGSAFVLWDDDLYVLRNRFIRNLDGRFFSKVFTAPVAANWHPLTVISYAVDYRLWGLNPFPYHLENIILHAFNTFLVAILAARLYEIRAKDGRHAAFAGLGAALLFGLHPLHVESVSWTSERKDVLSFFFFILSALAYLRYARMAPAPKRHYVLSLLFFAAALMSKPMAITLPFTLLLLDFFPLERFSVRNATIEKAPFFIPSALSALLTILAQRGLLKPLSDLSFQERAAIAIRSYAFYIWKMLFPAGLLPFYPLPPRPQVFDRVFAASLAFIVLASVLTLMAARRDKSYLTAWLYYMVTLFPVAGLIQVGDQASADRYSYYPLTGFFILASIGACRLLGRRVKIVIAFAAVALTLSFLTLRQEKIWRNSFTLWNAELAAYPDVPLAHNQRGLASMETGNYRQAISDFSKAAEGQPDYHEAWNNLGVAYYKTGSYTIAISDLTKALNGAPRYAEAYNNRANAYSAVKDYPRAIEDYTAAIRANPAYGQAYINRGILYRALGEYGRAIEDFNAARILDPASTLAYVNLGVTYLRIKSYGEAVGNLNAAIRIDPRDAAARHFLGLAYSELGDNEKASVYSNEASGLARRAKEPLRK